MWKLTDIISLILLCPMAWVDIKKKRIPVIYLWLLAAGNIIQQCVGINSGIGLVLGGIGVGLAFLLLSKVTEEGLGYGDSLGILVLGVGLGMWKLIRECRGLQGQRDLHDPTAQGLG